MKTTITELLNEKEILISRLNKMVYGSVEIRTNKDKKYIYVHYRLDGISQTKYVGEYSEQLHSLILENNNLAKQYKKRVKVINKELGALEFESLELTDDVKLNLDLARRNMVDSIYKQSILEGIATTYSDTETIVNGGIVKDMTAKDISKVVNLKRAWEFIMSEGVITACSNKLNVSINGTANKAIYDSAGSNIAAKWSNYLPTAGGTMTGNIIFSTSNVRVGAVTKKSGAFSIQSNAANTPTALHLATQANANAYAAMVYKESERCLEFQVV